MLLFKTKYIDLDVYISKVSIVICDFCIIFKISINIHARGFEELSKRRFEVPGMNVVC
jgi:hypothetical protein